MNAKQRRAHTRELTALYKGAVPSEFNAELVSELIDAGKDIKHKENVIEALRAEIEALKQQVEQGKRDAGWRIRHHPTAGAQRTRSGALRGCLRKVAWTVGLGWF